MKIDISYKDNIIQKILKTIALRIHFNKLRILLYRISGVKIGRGTRIARYVNIGPNVKIGDNSEIFSHTKLSNCIIGNNVKIEDQIILRYITMGNDCCIDKGVIAFGNPNNWISIGNEVTVGYYWFLDGTGGLQIGNNINLASHLGGIHTHSSLRNRLLGLPYKHKNGIERSPVIIDSYSWIGGKSTIQLGVKIGDHCVVLPNSSIIKDVPPYTMVGGVPARQVKKIIIKNKRVEFINL